MGLSRDTALVTTLAEVEAIATVQDLENTLDIEGGLQADDALLEAHRWVFDRLKRRHSTSSLATIANQAELKRAVVYRFLEVLAGAGYLAGGGGERAADEGARDYWGGQAIEQVDNFVPEFAAEDRPRRSAEGIPRLGNLDREGFFGPYPRTPWGLS